ncbi:Uncharacterised protein g5130 [Pycnogonum litorale]
MALMGLAFSVYQITCEYLHDGNIVTVMRITSDVYFSYPAITVCSNTPYRCSEALKNPKMSQLIPNGTCTDYLKSETPLIWRDDHVANHDETKTRYENVLPYIYSASHPGQIRNLTVSYQDFIEHCFYDFRSCDQKDFLPMVDHEFGQCYTFNSAWSSSEDGKLKYEPETKSYFWGGASTAFTIQFKINRSEVIPAISNGVGLHVVVHDRHYRPVRLNRQFIDVEPEKYTSIGMKKKIMTRVDSGTSRCRDDYHTDMKKMFERSIEENEKYDSVKCLNFVIQKACIENCNCRNIHFVGYENYPELEDCSLTNASMIRDCIFAELNGDTLKNYCSYPCRTEEYDLTVSSKQFRRSNSSFDDEEPEDSIFKYSTGWLKIYFETPETLHYTENQRFTLLSMIGTYGGYAGLYVGISVLSVVDFLDYIWDRFRNKPKAEKKSDDDDGG